MNTQTETTNEKRFNANEFNVTADQLAKAHGVHRVTINNWARQGVFPWVKVGGEVRTERIFHPEALTYTLGKIKSNLIRREFKTPFADFTTKPIVAKMEKPNTSSIETVIERTLNLILNKQIATDRKINLICKENGINVVH